MKTAMDGVYIDKKGESSDHAADLLCNERGCSHAGWVISLQGIHGLGSIFRKRLMGLNRRACITVALFRQ